MKILILLFLAGCASHVIDAGRSPEELKALSSMDLCQAYDWTRKGSQNRANVRAELESRNALTDREWALVESDEIDVGISEVALMCSWGHPGPPCGHIDDTVTSQGTNRRWVYHVCTYGKTQYVHTENGIVIDRRGVDWQN